MNLIKKIDLLLEQKKEEKKEEEKIKLKPSQIGKLAGQAYLLIEAGQLLEKNPSRARSKVNQFNKTLTKLATTPDDMTIFSNKVKEKFGIEIE